MKEQRKSDVLSLVTRGSRHQFGIAMALVTVIPLLALYFVAAIAWHHFTAAILVAISTAVVALMVLGYLLLAKYPATIIRLRKHMEKMVDGELPEKINLLKWEDDVTAIETSLNLIVDRLSRQVQDMHSEFRRIEWLLSKSTGATSLQQIRNRRGSVLCDRDATVTPEGLRALVGETVLQDIMGDSLDLIEHSASVHEKDGHCALFMISSGWCRLLYGPAQLGVASSPGGNSQPSEAAICRICHWGDACKTAVETGQVVEVRCPGGLFIYTAPVMAGDAVVGALSFSYGDPPSDPAELAAISNAFQVPEADLRRQAALYETRPPFIIAVAKNRLITSARLIGEMVERRRAEQVLRHSEEELRRHRDHLEDLAREQTAELRQANQQLIQEIAERQRAEKLKDEFVSTVSHELRTPLSIAKEGLALLLDRIPGEINAKQQHVLTVSRNNVERLTRLINDLLDISKIEAGRMELLKKRVDFISLVQHTVTSFETKANSKDLALQTRYPAATLDVIADPDRVMQILTNLVGNAIKFTDSGRVEIIVADKGRHVECTIADSGAGIAPEHQARLFKKFQQFHRVDGAGEKGTGLGLSIVKSIVELHGGHIWAESTLNKGSRFTFTLPKEPPDNPFLETVLRELPVARKEQTKFSLILIKVGFLTPTADDQLSRFRKRLMDAIKPRHLIRQHDLLVEKYPDELLILAAVDKSITTLILARLRKEMPVLAAEYVPNLAVTFRYGSCTFPEDGQEAEVLIKRAYDAMVRPAQSEKGGFVINKKILIIDDETEFAEMMQMRLEANGYQIELASNGASGIEKARTCKPKLILLDVMMPQMDGFQVLNELQHDETTKFIPVVMLTAKGEFKSITAAQKAGASDYLIKPCETPQLLKLISRYIK